MAKRMGRNTLITDTFPSVVGYAAVASKKEGEGPLGRELDVVCEDSYFGEKTWEKAESRMQKDAVSKAIAKANIAVSELDYVFAGDLLNQCIATTYGLRDMGTSFLGLYGACSTMAQSLGMAAVFVDTGMAGKAAAVTSSHFCSAERQFRFPLEYGGVRTPTSQWTVTGSGAAVVAQSAEAPYIKAVHFGKITDMGITDINNMGAAMAPAAAKTLEDFFSDTKTTPDDYDLIVTGDLGIIGRDLLRELMQRDGITLGKNYTDCGLLVYDRTEQKVESGGSGCGCSAITLCSYIMNRIKSGELQEVLFVATGALMSPTSQQQGESIPAIAHLVYLSNNKNAVKGS